MSSHREAPAISKDPVADSTDVYAFVSPENDGTVTILANYVPLQDPAGGPNFFEFGDDVLYEIHIDNTGSGVPSITYQFNFFTKLGPASTTAFLYNTGQILTLDSANWQRKQFYSVTRVIDGKSTPLTPPASSPKALACPPCNVGLNSIPNYANLSAAAVYSLDLPEAGAKVFAGQRAEGFFVDLGSIFDLGELRPLAAAHVIPGTAYPTDSAGYNSLAGKNVHSIALKLPISSLTSNQLPPTGPNDPHAVIGVYTTASRQQSRIFNPATGVTSSQGAYVQVSRLGSPLVNEVVVPLADKDFFNSQPPVLDKQFAPAVEHPFLQTLLPAIYPGAFPNLAAYTKPRLDLVAIFATGIPGALVKSLNGTQGTYQGGKVIAEMLRLNMAVPPTPTTSKSYSIYGVLGGDVAGFPNGRRLTDDVVTIELQAVAGLTIPLVDPSYKVDKVVTSVTQGVLPSARAYQAHFPYLADPHDGLTNPPGTPPNN